MSQPVRTLIGDFLKTRDPQFSPAALEDDVNLVKNRIIDSIGLVDLLLFLETETGRQIDFATLDPERMMSVAGILALFGEGGPGDG